MKIRYDKENYKNTMDIPVICIDDEENGLREFIPTEEIPFKYCGTDCSSAMEAILFFAAARLGEYDKAGKIISGESVSGILEEAETELSDSFDHVLDEIIYEVYLAKCRFDRECANTLTKTRGRLLVFPDVDDIFLGAGMVRNQIAGNDGLLKTAVEEWPGENRLGFMLMQVRDRLWIDYCDRSIAFIDGVLRDEDKLRWCRSYSAVVENEPNRQMELGLSAFTRDTHGCGADRTDFAKILDAGEIDEDTIWEGRPGKLRRMTGDELCACITYQFRDRKRQREMLMERGIGQGALIPYFEEIRNRLLEGIEF